MTRKVRALPANKSLPSWEQVVGEFILTARAQGKAETTVKDYQYYLPRFFASCPDAWPDYHKLKTGVKEYLLRYTNASPTTFNMRRKYIKAFFSWCVAEGYLTANPADGISKRKDPGKPRDVEDQAILRLLSVIDMSTYVGVRDYALILLQLDAGVRPGEALQLLPEHLNLPRLEVYIPAGIAKTRQDRTVVISPTTARALKRLLQARPGDWRDSIPLFASQDGQKMRVSSWTHRLRKYAKKAGVGRVTAYQLRHTSAIMQLRNGASAFHVQNQLGHTDLSMTKRYVNLAGPDLHREHIVCSPVANLLPDRKRVKRRLS